MHEHGENMAPAETLKNIRRIQIVTARMVTSIFAGEFRSVFRGRGLEFEEVREYQPGDDFRCIDWNVTAKAQRPFIKRFVEERELTVIFLLDVSLSCRFGTVDRLKSHLAAEICAVLSYAAVRNNDKVGLILFSDKIEKYLPPRKGNRQVFKIIRDALDMQPLGNGTDIALALEYVRKVIKRNAVLFILSDFHASDFNKPLAIACKRHDVVALHLTDPAEMRMPNVGIVKFEDAESGQSRLLDTSDAETRRAYEHNAHKLRIEKQQQLRSAGASYAELTPETPFLRTLYSFFRMRERRLAR